MEDKVKNIIFFTVLPFKKVYEVFMKTDSNFIRLMFIKANFYLIEPQFLGEFVA